MAEPTQSKGGYRIIGVDMLAMTPADLREFSEALREAFPSVRFLQNQTGYYDELGGEWPPTAPSLDLYRGWNERGDGDYDCLVWVDRADRSTEWSLRTRFDSDYEHDDYTLEFRLQFPIFGAQNPSEHRRDLLSAGAGYELVNLSPGRWHGGYYPHQVETKKFLQKVRRVFKRLTTNKVSRWDPYTFELYSRWDKGGYLWCGRHALDWARAHPHNWIDREFKPYDWEPPPDPPVRAKPDWLKREEKMTPEELFEETMHHVGDGVWVGKR